MNQLNVFGEPLPICCEDPMTGFTRSGSCETMDQDHGIHTVCAHMTCLLYTSDAADDTP